MVEGIRRVEKDETEKQKMILEGVNYLGKNEKILQLGEIPFRGLFRKTLVAGCDILTDTTIERDMVFAVRPQEILGGIPSEKFFALVGKKTNRDYVFGEIFDLEIIK